MGNGPDIDALAAVVYQAFSLIARRGKQMQATGELTLPERVALARLDRGGPASAAELARVEQISPQAMRVTLAALESQGLVRRTDDPTDGRRQVMSLTPSGVEMVRHDRDTRARRFATVLSEEFSPAELRTLAQAAPLIERLGARFWWQRLQSGAVAVLVIARILIGVGTSSAHPSAMLLIRCCASRVGLEAPPGRFLCGNFTSAARSSMCIYTVPYGLTQWLQAGRGLPAGTTGLLLLPMAALAAVIVQPVATRNLLRAPLVVAAVSCLAGSIGALLIHTHTPIIWILLVIIIFGITLGTTAPANQTALYTLVPAARIATASGLLWSCAYLGSIASSAVISTVFRTTVDDHSLKVIAWILVGTSVMGLVILVGDPITAPRRPKRLAWRRKQIRAARSSRPFRPSGGSRRVATPTAVTTAVSA